MHRRSPRRFSLAIEDVRGQLAPQTPLGAVQQRWSSAVGDAIAAEAWPIAERGGVLTVSCSASVWAQELDLMAPQIIERVNEVVRETRISRLRCVAVPPRETP